MTTLYDYHAMEARLAEAERERDALRAAALGVTRRVEFFDDDLRSALDALVALVDPDGAVRAGEDANLDRRYPLPGEVSCVCCADALEPAPPLCERCAPSFARYLDGSASCDHHEPGEEV